MDESSSSAAASFDASLPSYEQHMKRHICVRRCYENRFHRQILIATLHLYNIYMVWIYASCMCVCLCVYVLRPTVMICADWQMWFVWSVPTHRERVNINWQVELPKSQDGIIIEHFWNYWYRFVEWFALGYFSFHIFPTIRRLNRAHRKWEFPLSCIYSNTRQIAVHCLRNKHTHLLTNTHTYTSIFETYICLTHVG